MDNRLGSEALKNLRFAVTPYPRISASRLHPLLDMVRARDQDFDHNVSVRYDHAYARFVGFQFLRAFFLVLELDAPSESLQHFHRVRPLNQPIKKYTELSCFLLTAASFLYISSRIVMVYVNAAEITH